MDETAPRRGRLKVFLGYAAGVGKTYQMLGEARQLKAAGVDVVIGYLESHGRRDTMAMAEGLEQVPRAVIEYRGARFEEMDAEAVVRRRPRVAIVDELAHTNVPGSARAKRWEDVQELQARSIDVLTTMNVQHVESLNDQIWQSAGVRVRETVPDWVLQRADDVVMVDLAPRALLNRLARGVVYPPDRARAALEHFFKEPTLVALREMAMRQAAYVVESRLPPEEPPWAPAAEGVTTGAPERLLLLVGPEPSSAALIRRGRRVADYLRAECLAVCVSKTPDLRHLGRADRERLEKHLGFASALRIDTRVLEGRDGVEAVVEFARRNAVTQIFVSRDSRSGAGSWLRPSLVERLVSCAAGLQVTVVADRSRSSALT
jgi:two-component system, OmpR family, sensor histidine kinase KdpD